MLLVDDKRRKGYLFAFIDDMSRLIAHAEFYLSGGPGHLIYRPYVKPCSKAGGLSRKRYFDNGPAFRSHHLEEITASLGIALVHSPPYVPQGRGKIERLFRTVRSSFLPGFKSDTLRDINEAWKCWIGDVYHQRKPLGTGHAPLQRFTSTMEYVRPAHADLGDYFRKKAPRPAWPRTAPSPWPAGYTRPQCLWSASKSSSSTTTITTTA
ncbi:transposase [Desulfarculales bacterium]